MRDEGTADRLLQDVHASLVEQRELMTRSIALQEEATTLFSAQGKLWTGELQNLRALILSRPAEAPRPVCVSTAAQDRVHMSPVCHPSESPVSTVAVTQSKESADNEKVSYPSETVGDHNPDESPPPTPIAAPAPFDFSTLAVTQLKDSADANREKVAKEAPRITPPPVACETVDVAPKGRRSMMGQAADMVRHGFAAPDMEAGALDLRRKLDTRPTQSNIGLQRFMQKHPIRGYCRYIIQRPLFDIFFGLVVVASVALIGVEIEYTATNRSFSSEFLHAQTVCCVLFIFEVMIRVVAFGSKFCAGKDKKWNCFDVVCSGTMLIDITFEYTHQADFETPDTGITRIVRIARLLRIVRALRIMRATRASREFRKMSYALQYSALTLFWALLLLFFVMYFFATAFTQATTEAIKESGLGEDWIESTELASLYEFYGTLPRSFYSLFLAVSNGRDWFELVDPLGSVHWFWQALFVGFVAMTMFGVMNVVTSVFVESALQSTQHYKDLLIQENLKAKKMYLDHLLEVFKEIDEDGSGAITLDELDQFLLDPNLRTYLESMEINPDDAKTLFSLLDRDDSGSVSIDEFCQGCLRLKGDAKSFDIHCIIFEHQRLCHKWRELVQYLEMGFGPALTSAVEKAFDQRLGGLLKPGGMFTPGGMNATLTNVLSSATLTNVLTPTLANVLSSAMLTAPTNAVSSTSNFPMVIPMCDESAPLPPRTDTPKWFLQHKPDIIFSDAVPAPSRSGSPKWLL